MTAHNRQHFLTTVSAYIQVRSGRKFSEKCLEKMTVGDMLRLAYHSGVKLDVA